MAHHEFVFADRSEDLDLDLGLDGELPSSLTGTFYAIGGAGCRVGDTALHILDAHGRVVAVTIASGKASLRARMVETPLLRAEREAGTVVKRRFFENKPGRWSNLFDVDLANPAGHNVARWGEHLVAMNDPGFFVLDPVTLETRGPAPIAPAKGATFSPMPHRDPRTGHHVLFEVRPGLRDTLIVREIDDAFRIVVERTYKLPRGAAFFHDVAVSEHYYLAMQWASISIPKLLWGAAIPAEAVRFDPATTPMLHLLPRDGGAPISIPMPGGRLHFHFWNAFESDGRVVVDTIGYDGNVDFRSTAPPNARPADGASPTPRSSTWRYTVEPKNGRIDAARLTDAPAEAPEIHPARRGRAYRYGWAPTRGSAGDEHDPGAFVWFHALARHDFEQRTTETWDAGPSRYVSGAAFVPREGGDAEDDGHVLALVQDAAKETTTLAVFDAARVAGGPIAELSGAGLLGAISHVTFARA